MKVQDLGLAMRKVRFTPGPVELQEIQKEVDIKTDKLLKEAKKKALETKGVVPTIPSGVDRAWFTQIISAKMNDFQSEKELEEAFNIMDEDHSGSIDASEFEFVMRHLGAGFSD
jgi:Ca2+-binding EF-hand superfamily protein